VNDIMDIFDDVPSSKFETVQPGSYIVKLVRVEKAEDGQFGPRRRWVFHLADAATGTPAYRADGSLFEFAQLSSTKLGRKARAREYAEALLNRDLTDGERGADLVPQLVGKKALALIGENANGWTEVIRMQPLKATAEAAVGAF
jgi:hypothetical protein